MSPRDGVSCPGDRGCCAATARRWHDAHDLARQSSATAFRAVARVFGAATPGDGVLPIPHQPAVRPEPALNPGWPKPHEQFIQVAYQEVRATLPKVEGAEYVNDDELCGSCHGAYASSFAAKNVHRGDGCESCHGPASKHLETKGKEPGMIFSFKNVNPAVRAEACLKCHEENRCSAGTQWRTSKHAHCGVSCVDCHRAHYDVPPGTPVVTEQRNVRLEPRGPRSSPAISGRSPIRMRASNRRLRRLRRRALSAAAATGRRTAGRRAPPGKKSCRRSAAPRTTWAPWRRTSATAATADKQLQEVAGPHQICGPNGFNCTTCHDPHGQISEESRQGPVPAVPQRRADHGLALVDARPATAWPAPIATIRIRGRCVPQFVNIDHTQVTRPKRLPMSVQEPEACYKCHPKIYGLNALPSHHPIKEGKMVCSDCHDAHGQTGEEPQGGDGEPAVLQVPCREARAVRLRAPAGDRELRRFATSRTAPWPTTC